MGEEKAIYRKQAAQDQNGNWLFPGDTCEVWEELYRAWTGGWQYVGETVASPGLLVVRNKYVQPSQQFAGTHSVRAKNGGDGKPRPTLTFPRGAKQ